MNKPGTKRTVPKKMIVKKSGSLGDDSDRSLSPTDIINVKENKPGQRLANSNGLVKRTKPTVRAVSSLPVKKPVSKSPLPKQSITKPTVKKPSGLSTPVRTSVKKTVSAKPSSEVKAAQRCLSPTPSSPDSQHWKTAAVHTRQGVLASSFTSRPLPTRGNKKVKKVYNPSSLLSLCREAVGSVICEQELDEEAKENIKRRCLTQALMHKLWDTLTKDTKKNRLTIEALVSERDSLSAELTQLKESLDQRINTLTEQHREILSKATSDLTHKYTEERTQLVTDYESTISDLRTKLSNVQNEHEEEKLSIHTQHAQEMQLLHQQYKDQIDNTVLCHDKEKNRFLDTIAALEQQNDYLEEQLVEKEQTLQSEVDYRVQQKVARYATINAELQSLQDVIDMKNKETKVLRNEVFDLTNKIEDITELKRDNRSMRNINEQLEATIAMKTVSERNLSMTESTLREELGQRVNETNNLSLKCEELHFKLSTYEEVIGKDHNIAALNGIYGSPRHQSTPANSPVRLPNSLRREEEHKPWANNNNRSYNRPQTLRPDSPILNINQLETFHTTRAHSDNAPWEGSVCRVVSQTTYQAHYSLAAPLERSRSESFKYSNASSLDDHPDFAPPHSRGNSPIMGRAVSPASPYMGIRATSPMSYSRGGPGYDLRPSRQSSEQGSPSDSGQGSPCSDMMRPYIDPLSHSALRTRSLTKPPLPCHTSNRPPLEPSTSYSDTDLLNDRNIKPSELNAVYDQIKSLQPPSTHIDCKVTSDTDLLKKDKETVLNVLYDKMIALQNTPCHTVSNSPRTRRPRAQSERGRRVSVHFSKALGQMGLIIDSSNRNDSESIQIEHSSTPSNLNLSTPPLSSAKTAPSVTKSRPHSIPPLQSGKRAVSFDAFKDLLIKNANSKIDKKANEAKSTSNANNVSNANQAESSSADSSDTDTPVYLQRAQSLQHIGNSSHSDEKFFTFTDKIPPTLTEKIKKKLERSKVLSDVKSRSQTRLKANTSAGMVTVIKDDKQTDEYLTKPAPGRSDLTLKSADHYKGNLYTYNNDSLVDLPVTPVFMRRNKHKNKNSLF